MGSHPCEHVAAVLDQFEIETPSWAYADTGTRFGKFTQAAAAIDLSDKLADAAQVHRLTGCCPSVAVHVLWDFPENDSQLAALEAEKLGIRIGSINPNLFQDQEYKFGSLAHPDSAVREKAVRHCLDCIELARHLDSRMISLWLADGTNYPGQDQIRGRKQRLESSLRRLHDHLTDNQTLLIEYKPFEPAFYHTDIADWGMAYLLARQSGPRAKVLVDLGHHYASQNIEQIVAWLLDEDMLGGFHFNDRRYADDDLTLGSIDPYQLFRIFAEIFGVAADLGGALPGIAYMIDQSHNLKPKVEAMIQSVMMAQELFAKASLIDQRQLRTAQLRCDIVAAERLLQDAFATDVRPLVAHWRQARGLPADPWQALRESGYIEDVTRDRTARRAEMPASPFARYA
jgi:L-rhamnose isomerase/sugar isomerase